MYAAIPAGHRVKLKESKKDKYLDLARELKKKTVNMKVTINSNVIDTLGIVTKRLVQGLEDLEITVETIQTTGSLRSARIPRRVLETCYHSNSIERPSANAEMKNSQGVTQ